GVYGSRDLGWPNLQPGKLIETVGLELGAKTVTNFAGDAFRVVRRVQRGGGEWIGLVSASEINEPDAVAIADLKDRAMAAEAGLKERTAFFAGLGHDLKTPLNAILGFADLMKAEVRGPMPEAYKDYPTIIHESGQDLMLLVEDILDLAKADANSHRLELEPVDLVASAASVIRQLEDQAARASVKLALTGDAEVWAEADPRAVRQIWQNLLSNAIKYSNEGDTVTLTAGSLASSVFLSVKDHGAGMDQEDLDRIARPFAQGVNAKGRAGTGLGLAVVQRFAELHGGRVVIDTAPGKGTRIRVTLPAASSDAVSPFGNAAQ
ncbi:MAG: HAMP domain-containing sensor histidine kinase, partial [Pseudomonadota bacterium]